MIKLVIFFLAQHSVKNKSESFFQRKPNKIYNSSIDKWELNQIVVKLNYCCKNQSKISNDKISDFDFSDSPTCSKKQWRALFSDRKENKVHVFRFD